MIQPLERALYGRIVLHGFCQDDTRFRSRVDVTVGSSLYISSLREEFRSNSS